MDFSVFNILVWILRFLVKVNVLQFQVWKFEELEIVQIHTKILLSTKKCLDRIWSSSLNYVESLGQISLIILRKENNNWDIRIENIFISK